jgi:hypothetical protein
LQFQAYLKILLKTAFQKRLQNLLVFLTAAESPIPTGLKDLESLECSHKKKFLKAASTRIYIQVSKSRNHSGFRIH